MRWEPRPASASEMVAEKWPGPSPDRKPIPMGSTGSEARSVFPPQGSAPDQVAGPDQVAAPDPVAGLDRVAVPNWVALLDQVAVLILKQALWQRLPVPEAPAAEFFSLLETTSRPPPPPKRQCSVPIANLQRIHSSRCGRLQQRGPTAAIPVPVVVMVQVPEQQAQQRPSLGAAPSKPQFSRKLHHGSAEQVKQYIAKKPKGFRLNGLSQDFYPIASAIQWRSKPISLGRPEGFVLPNLLGDDSSGLGQRDR